MKLDKLSTFRITYEEIEDFLLELNGKLKTNMTIADCVNQDMKYNRSNNQADNMKTL